MNQIHCPECSSLLAGDARYCGICGKEISRPETAFRYDAEAVARAAARSTLYGRKAVLDEAVRLCGFAAEGYGNLMYIQSPAGMGKSAVLADIEETARAGGFQVIRLSGLPEYSQLTFHPLTRLLEYALEIKKTDSFADVGRRLEELTRFGLKQYDIERIRDLIMVDETLEDRRRPDEKNRLMSLAAAFMRLIMALADRRPLFLSFDHLHWFDAYTLDFISKLAGNIRERHILMAVCDRENLARLKNADNLHFIHLEKLSGRDILYIARAHMEADVLPVELEEKIINVTDGNPYTVKALLDLLSDQNWIGSKNGKWKLSERLHDYEFPRGLQNTLVARMDFIQPHLLELLCIITVLSSESTRDGIFSQYQHKKHLDEDLRELIERHWLKQGEQCGRTNYVFNQNYLHEIIYRSIQEGDRQKLHTGAGAYFQRNIPCDARMQSSLVVSNTARCDHEKSHLVHFLERSGERLAQKLHFHLASMCFEKAVLILEYNLRRNPDEAFMYRRKQAYLIYELAEAHSSLGQKRRSWQEFRHAVTLAEENELPFLAVDALLAMAAMPMNEADSVKQARAYLNQALRKAQDTGSTFYLARVKHALGEFCRSRSEFEEGREYLREAEENSQESEKGVGEDLRLINLVAFDRGRLELERGDLHNANIYLSRAVKESAALKDRVTLTRALEMLSLLFAERRMADRAAEYSEHGLQVARKLGDRPTMAGFCHRLGRFKQSMGLFDEAHAYYTDALELSREVGWEAGVKKCDSALTKLKEAMQEQ